MASPTDGRPQLRRIAAALAITGALSAVVVSRRLGRAADACTWSTRAAWSRPAWSPVARRPAAAPAALTGTDGNGRLTLDVLAGRSASRSPEARSRPEGAGVAYTVPDPVPAVPVTIDAAGAARHGRARDRLGRGVAARARERGARRPGTRGADAVEHAQPRRPTPTRTISPPTDQFSHTALADPGVRAVDQGWPVPGGIARRRGARAGAVEGARAPGLEAERTALDPADDGRPRLGRRGPRRRALDHDAGRTAASRAPPNAADSARTRPSCRPGSRRPRPGATPRRAPDRGHPGKARPRRPALRMALRQHGRKLVVRVRVLTRPRRAYGWPSARAAGTRTCATATGPPAPLRRRSCPAAAAGRSACASQGAATGPTAACRRDVRVR